MYLGIDCGTQGTETLLIDEDGTKRDHGYAAHAIVKRVSVVDAFRVQAKTSLLKADA
jgi:sugar (pentulose or hexulose) kinase